jgi:hypothetical protein
MTKPTLLPGGCFYQRGVDSQRFCWSQVFFGCCILATVLAAGATHAADVALYTVTKGIRYEQTNSGAPVFLPLDEFVFEANVRSTSIVTTNTSGVISTNSSVLRAIVEATDNIDRVLDRQSPTEWEFDADENNLHDLNVNYPNGRYTFRTRGTNDGWRTNMLTLDRGAHPYPTNTPRILNYSELQSASGTGFVQVSWAPFTNGTSSDSIQLRIETTNGVRAFETRDFGEPGALDGTATNAFIEPGNLRPGTTYFAWLEFRKSSDLNTNSYPGATGWAYFHKRTDFRIRTSTNEFLDLEAYTVSKGINYVQTNMGPPTLEGGGSNAYVFSASLESTASNLITFNRITAPNGNVTNCFPEECRPETQLDFSYVTSSQLGLNNEFPDGDYRFDVTTEHQGSRSMTLSLTGSDYPPMPEVLNFDPSIPVRTNNALNIIWKPWVGGRSSDFVQFRLLTDCRTVFETGDFGDNDALNGTATNAVIPADLLEPGETYRATLTFRRFTDLDFTSWLGAAGIASYYSRLKFDVSVLLDVREFELAKGRNYAQTNLSDVVPDGTNAFEFFAVAEAQTLVSLVEASLRFPDNSTVPLTAASNSTEYAHSVLSSNSLDSAYPAGPYTFDVETLNDGHREVLLSLAPLSYPPAPRFLHDPAARVPHDQTNVITWEAWNGGGTNDFVQLRIRNAGTNVWETPDFGEEGALNGTVTNAAIPANVLSRAETYSARLAFRRFTDNNTNSYPGSTALAYYFAETQFDLRTIAPDVEDYEIAKGRNYLQGETEIVPEAGFEFQFNARVQGSITGLITSATLSWPGVTDLILTADPTFEEFTYEEFAASETSFEERFPSGSYQFVVPTSNDGTQFLALILTNPVYPPAPQIRNYRFAPAEIRPGPAEPLEWDPWVGGTTNDFIQVQIRDAGTNVFETPNFGDLGALNGLSTNMVIPENLLKPGKNYGVRVTFRRFDTINENPPGTVGTLSYFARTKFNIVTLPPDAESYSLFKGREYTQTNSGAPVVAGYIFSAVVVGNNIITNPHVVRLTPPNRPPIALVDNGASVFELIDSFATEEEFTNAYPDGDYVLEVTGTNYGTTNVTLHLTNAYPNPPHIANYAAAGSINASDDFFLQWDPFQDGTVEDYIGVGYLGIAVDSAYFSPAPGTMGALHGLHTSFAAQRDDLEANSLYNAYVSFEKVLVNDETTYTEVPGRVGYYSRTSFRAVTQGQGNPPTLPSASGPIPMNRIEFLPGNQVQFPIGTVPGAAYLIEGSTNLVNWTVLNSFTADSSLTTVLSQAPPSRAFFIRASLLRNQ